MSSFNRRSLLLMAAGLPFVAGCGFEPVYGTGGAALNLRNTVLVDAPNNEDQFELVRQLEHRLGAANNARFGLSVALDIREEGVALTSDNRTTRKEVIGSGTYALRDLDSKEVLISGKVDSFTGYSTTGSTVSEIAARRDARRRLMIILADRITTELIAQADALPA
ncbi:LPS assembly lipoprotein LptE [Cognatishimia activa]|uniref:LPS-assembly lipoprotein n=1 Tax=Cognatishimia activa TaxID=1715691 RepID=A0A0P1ILA9_9RHOB|nr:LPS assembly lipoprotein LptE [Cognatishimia activa]MEE2944011.1 LPS assembly lipoprotein LptE [Pseudomonadota bacterium]CUI56896.1 hypothetical protein TA5113_00813 [Cognatishimia activa]CUK24405.1 hypothetical protein TA5114_00188 [Cognatishimia activa]